MINLRNIIMSGVAGLYTSRTSLFQITAASFQNHTNIDVYTHRYVYFISEIMSNNNNNGNRRREALFGSHETDRILSVIIIILVLYHIFTIVLSQLFPNVNTY